LLWWRKIQFQKSKGSLIVTGALELSTNQVTHFFSDIKESEEMLHLLEILLRKYKGNDCIYLSWDAAKRHCSKAFTDRVEDIALSKSDSFISIILFEMNICQNIWVMYLACFLQKRGAQVLPV